MSKTKQLGLTKKMFEFIVPRVKKVADLLLYPISIIGSLSGLIPGFSDRVPRWLFWCFVIVSAVTILLEILIFLSDFPNRRQYYYIKMSEELSDGTLQALKDASTVKTKSILQSTYGRVPEWHPTDYTKNVLVYDVHEQIRTILFGLQKLIVDNTEGLSEEHVTVDFVYCYPKQNNQDGRLPTEHQPNVYDQKTGWRLITSGNHSLGGSVHSFLENESSFFHHVDECGYAFYNDKHDCINDGHYIVSNKDKNPNNKGLRNGSIVGLKIELKNDEPETVFVKGILTITTYGKKLFNKSIGIKEKDYQEIFEHNVLNSYKSLLLSELSQMFIRHAIKDGEMCPKTGKIKGSKKEQQQIDQCPITCKWTKVKCPFPKDKCHLQIIPCRFCGKFKDK